jgi:nucleoside-diphosphate-sugar epimerase
MAVETPMRSVSREASLNSPTPSPVLVTGGTGRLGRLVVPRLCDAGYDVRVLTRQHNRGSDGIEYVVGDLTTGQGVDSALVGIGTVVHCASSTKGDAEATRNLVLATSIAGTQHLV